MLAARLAAVGLRSGVVPEMRLKSVDRRNKECHASSNMCRARFAMILSLGHFRAQVNFCNVATASKLSLRAARCRGSPIGVPRTRAAVMVVPIHTEMDAQTARILDFCNQSAPGCIVHVMPVGPDSFRLRVKDGGDVLIDSDVALYTPELAAKSDDDLWELLENVSRQRIKRK